MADSDKSLQPDYTSADLKHLSVPDAAVTQATRAAILVDIDRRQQEGSVSTGQ